MFDPEHVPQTVKEADNLIYYLGIKCKSYEATAVSLHPNSEEFCEMMRDLMECREKLDALAHLRFRLNYQALERDYGPPPTAELAPVSPTDAAFDAYFGQHTGRANAAR